MKNTNVSLKQYLRAYVNYNQDDWIDLLLITKFEVNFDKNVSSNISPFLFIKSYIPRSKIKPSFL